MKVDEGFHEQVKALDTHFDTAKTALAKGDFAGLQRVLGTIVQVANVLLVVLGALNGAKAKK